MKINLKRFLIVLTLIIFLSFSLGFTTRQTFNKEPNDKNEQDVPEINRNIYTSRGIDKRDSDSILVSKIKQDTPTDPPTVEPVIEEETEWMVFKATAYCPCEKCCGKWAKNRPNGIVYTANGEIAKEGVTIAADWDVLPPGTEVEIKEIGTRKVQDRGGGIRGNRIDIYFETHEQALKFGVQEVQLRIMEEGKQKIETEG